MQDALHRIEKRFMRNRRTVAVGFCLITSRCSRHGHPGVLMSASVSHHGWLLAAQVSTSHRCWWSEVVNSRRVGLALSPEHIRCPNRLASEIWLGSSDRAHP
jgi:hypothetical protein